MRGDGPLPLDIRSYIAILVGILREGEEGGRGEVSESERERERESSLTRVSTVHVCTVFQIDKWEGIAVNN